MNEVLWLNAIRANDTDAIEELIEVGSCFFLPEIPSF